MICAIGGRNKAQQRQGWNLLAGQVKAGAELDFRESFSGLLRGRNSVEECIKGLRICRACLKFHSEVALIRLS